MSGFHWNEQYIKEALDTAANSCNPPDDLKERIDARLKWQEKQEVVSMKKMNIKKTVAVAAAVCALTGTVCMAAEKFTGFYVGTSTPFTEVTTFADVKKLEKKAGVQTDAKEILDNGFVFDCANIMETYEMDAEGNKKGRGFSEIIVSYKKGAQNVDYIVSEKESEFTQQEADRAQVMESDGVTYYLSRSNYLFVPGEYELTDEEKAAEEAGELFISVGSEEREEKVHEGIYWNVDGQGYSLAGWNMNLSADEWLDMAEQMK